jgi:hypothetical protein
MTENSCPKRKREKRISAVLTKKSKENIFWT